MKKKMMPIMGILVIVSLVFGYQGLAIHSHRSKFQMWVAAVSDVCAAVPRDSLYAAAHTSLQFAFLTTLS